MSTVSDWGPAAWKFLHAITFAYPDLPTIQEQNDAEKMFLSLSSLLPCLACREHYVAEISAHPPDARSKTTLSTWLVDLHNRVNQRLGKPVFSYLAAESLYSSQCSADCGKEKTIKQRAVSSNSGLNGLMLLLVFAIVVLLIIRAPRSS